MTKTYFVLNFVFLSCEFVEFLSGVPVCPLDIKPLFLYDINIYVQDVRMLISVKGFWQYRKIY